MCLEMRRQNTSYFLSTHAVVPWESMAHVYAAVPRGSVSISYFGKEFQAGCVVCSIILCALKLWGQVSYDDVSDRSPTYSEP